LNVLVGVSNWAIYAWGPTYLRERFGLGLGSAGLSGTAWLQAASFIGVVAGGIWTDRWFRRHRGARFIVPAIGYATAAPALWVFGSSDSLVVAIGALVVCGLGRGFYDGNLMPMIRTVVDGRYSATAYGLLNFTGCLAAGATTYAAGALRDANVDLAWVFRCAGAGLTVTAFLLFFLRQKTRKSLS
jgi:sugar phosphate permease